MSAAEVVGIGLELCRAMSAVHGAGLLHRDIKTRNVMRAEDGRIVLMDFGTGRDLEDDAGSDLASTPLYLAPEVLQGQQATVRSDIYSLGVLLYHLVTGAYPAHARTLREVRRSEQSPGECEHPECQRENCTQNNVSHARRLLVGPNRAKTDKRGVWALPPRQLDVERGRRGTDGRVGVSEALLAGDQIVDLPLG